MNTNKNTAAAPKVSGYRVLSPAEISRMNTIKEHEKTFNLLMVEIQAAHDAELEAIDTTDSSGCHDELEAEAQDISRRTDQWEEAVRWREAARLSMQTAYMQLVRSVARPSLLLPGQ